MANMVMPGMMFRHLLTGKTVTAEKERGHGWWLVEGDTSSTYELSNEGFFAIASAPALKQVRPGQVWRTQFGSQWLVVSDVRDDVVGCRPLEGSPLYSPNIMPGKCGVDWWMSNMKLISEAPDAPAVPEAERVHMHTGGPLAKMAAPPEPRKHDLSNPYLVAKHFGEKVRLCDVCGCTIDTRPCYPYPGWRAKHEEAIAQLEVSRQTARQLFPKKRPPPDQPYRNDVSGIGARLGGYLNVAPERGR